MLQSTNFTEKKIFQGNLFFLVRESGKLFVEHFLSSPVRVCRRTLSQLHKAWESRWKVHRRNRCMETVETLSFWSPLTLQIRDGLQGKTTPTEWLADTEEARTINVGWMPTSQSSEHGTFSSWSHGLPEYFPINTKHQNLDENATDETGVWKQWRHCHFDLGSLKFS